MILFAATLPYYYVPHPVTIQAELQREVAAMYLLEARRRIYKCLRVIDCCTDLAYAGRNQVELTIIG